MRMRPFLAVALLIAAAPALRAQEKPDAKPDKKAPPPAIVLRLKSLDGIMSDVKYLAKLADQEELLKQGAAIVEGEIDATGIDPKQPFALYADLSQQLQESPIVFLVPI